MRTHVTVDGITLSRSQVEQAQKGLNEPEFRGGDVVKVRGDSDDKEYIVISPASTEAALLNEHYNMLTTYSPGERIRLTDGRDTWNRKPADLVKVGKLVG